MDFRAAGDTYLLITAKRRLSGPCRNCFHIPRSHHAKQSNRPKRRCYRTVKSDSQRDGVSSHYGLGNSHYALANAHHTRANFYLHSNCDSRSDCDFFHDADSVSTAAFAAIEIALALYRRWHCHRGVGLFDVCEMETASGNCRATHVLSAFGLGCSAEAPRESVHQLRVIFSSQCICRPRPARG